MKFLADMGVSLVTASALRDVGHDIVHLRDEGRLRNQTPAAVNPRLFRVLDECADELSSGAVVVVENDGFRLRRLPIRS